jgi:hypothetical protein
MIKVLQNCDDFSLHALVATNPLVVTNALVATNALVVTNP